MKERRKTKRILWLSLSGIAASLLIALGATFYSRQEPHFRDTFTNPDMAMAYANETLLFVSSKYTEGLEQLEPIQKLGHATLPLKKGLRRVNNGLSEIDKVYLINKIF